MKPLSRDYSSLALFALSLLSMAPFALGGAIWDDALFVEHNHLFRAAHPLTEALTRSFFASAEGSAHSDAMDLARYYRPVVSLWYLALHSLFGARLMAWHVALMGVHLGAVALAQKLSRALFDDPWAATLAAGVFALHASRWLSVGWISGSPDPLLALSSLGAMLLTARALTGPTWSAGAKIAALGALALLTKETALALAPSVALMTLTVSRGASRRASLTRLALPITLLSLAWLGLRAVLLPIGTAQAPSLGLHLKAVLATVGVYLRVVAWPLPTTALRSVGTLYVLGPPEIPWTWALVGALGVLGLALGFAQNLRARPLVSLGMGFWALWLLPVSNLAWTAFPSLASDRFLYLPMLGAGISLAALCTSLTGRARNTVFTLCAAILFAHALILGCSSPQLRDDARFWQRELAINPDSAVAATHRADWLEAHGAPGAAFSLRFHPLDLAMRHRPELATSQALEALIALTRFIPDDHPAMTHALSVLELTNARAQTVRQDVLGFSFRFDPARERAPSAATLSQRLCAAADLYSRLGRPQDAQDKITEALTRCPACSEPRALRALIAARERRWESAQTELSAMAAAPELTGLVQRISDARALSLRASALRASGNLTGAAGREVEADVLLWVPELARARISPFALSPAVRIARARIELSEFHFARAEALLRDLRPDPDARVQSALSALDALAITQRARVRGLEDHLTPGALRVYVR